ncbi:hypothetical protein [Methylosinus trichosporium]
MSHVEIDVKGVTVMAAITDEAVEDLALKPGVPVDAGDQVLQCHHRSEVSTDARAIVPRSTARRPLPEPRAPVPRRRRAPASSAR